MKDQIDTVYEIFRSMVIASDKIKTRSPLFYRAILSDLLESKATNDKSLLKLAVLSDYQEWEELYQHTETNLRNCLGVESQNLTNRGKKHFQISRRELRLLREEILRGDSEYFKLVEELKNAKEFDRSSGTLDSFSRLFFAYLNLGRISEAHRCIQDMRAYLERFEQEVAYAILYARLLNAANEDDNPEVFDLKTIKEVLDLLTKWSEINRLRSYVTHAVYLENWLRVIQQYLSVLEKNHYQNATDSSHRQEVNKLERNIAATLDPSWVNFVDIEFIKESPSQVFDLMKKHDELLMELAEISFDPLEFYYDWKMYFRGNENLLWRKLLDMTFPQKLSFFLFTGIEGIPAKQFQRKMSEFTLPDDQTSKKFVERLQAEFPECAELIESELSEHDSDPNEQIFCVPGDKDRAEEESGEETPPQ